MVVVLDVDTTEVVDMVDTAGVMEAMEEGIMDKFQFLLWTLVTNSLDILPSS